HTTMDGVSWGITLRNLNLERRMIPLKALPEHYLDFAVQQIDSVERDDFECQIRFWEREHTQLPDILPLLPFSRVKARCAEANYEGHTAPEVIGHDPVAGIKRATQTLRITPFHFHPTAIEVLLAKVPDVEDLCMSLADASRGHESFSNT
ncbi:hypothetical protein BDR22DRAFT_776968, partial [Usnea florida]